MLWFAARLPQPMVGTQRGPEDVRISEVCRELVAGRKASDKVCLHWSLS